jgi:hypothetical protein
MEVTGDLKRREFFYCLGELRNAADSVLGLEGYQEVTCGEVFRGIEDQLRGWLARCERFAMEEEDSSAASRTNYEVGSRSASVLRWRRKMQKLGAVAILCVGCAEGVDHDSSPRWSGQVAVGCILLQGDYETDEFMLLVPRPGTYAPGAAAGDGLFYCKR